jgi:hypothetical protein
MAYEKLKRQKSPGTDQIPNKFIKAGGKTVHSEIQKLINSNWNKDKWPQKWRSQPVYLFIRRMTKQTIIIIEAYHSYQLHTKFYPAFFSQG